MGLSPGTCHSTSSASSSRSGAASPPPRTLPGPGEAERSVERLFLAPWQQPDTAEARSFGCASLSSGAPSCKRSLVSPDRPEDRRRRLHSGCAHNRPSCRHARRAADSNPHVNGLRNDDNRCPRRLPSGDLPHAPPGTSGKPRGNSSAESTVRSRRRRLRDSGGLPQGTYVLPEDRGRAEPSEADRARAGFRSGGSRVRVTRGTGGRNDQLRECCVMATESYAVVSRAGTVGAPVRRRA
jgi:hypothetical protein